jgi:uncharacterized membrane protein YhaH (DUF805 family)
LKREGWAKTMSELLLSFSGRLNRKPYWLINLILVATVFVILVLVAMLGGSAALAEFSAFGAALLSFVVALFPAWIVLATGVKRLHDRNKSAWWLLLFYLLPGVLQGIGETAGDLGIVLMIAGIAISIWALVEVGFLRGTVGPNRYGPDPLEART